LVREVVKQGQTLLGRPPQINLSVASFIPKPHTPFQWLPMAEEQELRDKYRRLKSLLRRYRSVRFKEHGIKSSLLEAVFSRGDRRLNRILVHAWQAGARFDSWNEHFRWDLWQQAFTELGVDYRAYLGTLDRADPLPWDNIQTGVHRDYLLRELDLALEAQPTSPCHPRLCRECGGCDFGFQEELPRDPDVKRGPSPEPPLGWKKTDEAIRYRVIYEKVGLARFISHNDLVSCIQRGFRRARVPVEFSRGYHPKMRMSFAPALALGMRGLREMMDFRSSFEIESGEFCERVNDKLPQGIRMLGLERLKTDAEPLSRELTGQEYSVDLNGNEIVGALKRMQATVEYAGLSSRDIVRRRIRELDPGKTTTHEMEITCTLRDRQLQITVPIFPSRNVRVQDLEELLCISHPAFSLTRERLLLRS
jgi:radical SAM-linked protein